MVKDEVNEKIVSLAKNCGLERAFPAIKPFIEPSISFGLTRVKASQNLQKKSHLGGSPDLPKGFKWPEYQGRLLDFVLQVNLAEVAEFDLDKALPAKGLLTFFYDLEEQPWGFDPEELDGFRVVYFAGMDQLYPAKIPDRRDVLPICALNFSSNLSIPSPWSRTFEKIEKQIELTEEERDAYFKFQDGLNQITYKAGGKGDQHHLLGHSANIQGDMQIEAQLVRNGIYCGDAKGYRSPQAKVLEAGADDWRLLLQLDSDDEADLMWGDVGMLYLWIRKQDLQAAKFDNLWLGLQCC